MAGPRRDSKSEVPPFTDQTRSVYDKGGSESTSSNPPPSNDRTDGEAENTPRETRDFNSSVTVAQPSTGLMSAGVGTTLLVLASILPRLPPS